MNVPRVRLGELLVRAGLISAPQLDEALVEQARVGKRLGSLLVETGLVSETQVTQILSQQLSVPWVSLHHIDFSRQLLDLVPVDVVERYCLIPIYVRRVRGLGDALYVAMDDPTNEQALKEVAERAALHVRAMIAPPSDIRAAIRAYYGIGEEPAAPAPPPPPQIVPRDDEEADVPTGIHRAVTRTPPDGTPPASARAAPPPSQPDLDRAVDDLVGADARSRASSRADATPLPRSGTSEVRSGPVASGGPVPPSSPEHSLAAGSDAVPGNERADKGARLTKKAQRRMIALTLLDGTTIQLPAKGKPKTQAASSKEASDASPAPAPPVEAKSASAPSAPSAQSEQAGDQLTTKDLVAALRAAAHGADASEVLGENIRWEAMFSALLSLLVKKRIIADWEFVEEFKKV